MDAMVSSDYKHTSLPQLSTSKEVSRRDSLSSSRTRDSGYNSDLEVAFSPLEYVDADQRMPEYSASSLLTNLRSDVIPTPHSSISSSFFGCKSIFSKPRRTIPDPSPAPPLFFTSNPNSIGTVHENPSPCTSDVECSKPSNIKACFRDRNSRAIVPNQNNEIDRWIKDNLPAHNRPKERVSSITSLTSASSCEMYTDVSDDEQEVRVRSIRPALTCSTLKIIDVIMRKIEVNLRYVAYKQCNGGKSSTASSSKPSTSSQSSRKGYQNNSKRKPGQDDHTPPNDDDEDGPNKRRRFSLATAEGSDHGARFACPFFKHEPHRYRNRRTCPGPGWPTVHRMKEHLYRAHSQSIYCPRCYTMFDADADLTNHLRSAHCHVSAPQPIEGINRETQVALRKRSPALRMEEDKWRDVYRLLFPNVAVEDIPSPFYDSDSPSEDSRRFRRELLRRVHQELLTTAGHISGPMEQQLLQQVANIIRRCEDDLLTSFDSSSMTAPPFSDRRTSTTSTLSTVSTQPLSHNSTPVPAQTTAPQFPSPFTAPPTSAPRSDPSIPCGPWSDPPSQAARHVEHSDVHFRAVPWDQAPAPTPFSTWVDWDAIFAPAPEEVCAEMGSGFAVPVWEPAQ